MRLLAASVCLALLASGCQTLPTNRGVKEGMVWCNVRYLDAVEYYRPPFTGANMPELAIAQRGYIYALAGAAILQEGEAPEDSLNEVGVLKRIPALDEGRVKWGFRAATFETLPTDGSKPELIVAFKGTNDVRDWLAHNLWLFPEQYDNARRYLKKVDESGIERSRIVVTGFSLGGGLASHVTQHSETKDIVDEAWVFNPSPRDGVRTLTNKKVWFASASGEILGWARTGYSGAPSNQQADDYNLINASNVFKHYRYVLARQMLHYADLKEHIDSQRSSKMTQPMQILQDSSDEYCTPRYQQAIEDLRSGKL